MDNICELPSQTQSIGLVDGFAKKNQGWEVALSGRKQNQELSRIPGRLPYIAAILGLAWWVQKLWTFDLNKAHNDNSDLKTSFLTEKINNLWPYP